MQYRKLGGTDMDVSVIALGCWPFAGGRFWGDQDDADSEDTVRAALDAGINFFDTAEGYGRGHSERVLGRGLEGRRHEAVIATKVSASHLAAGDVAQACERSLANLRTDTIDLYQIHWPNWQVPLAETVGALEKLLAQGKIRAVGVSNFAVRDLSDILEHCACATNQFPYSLLWRVIEHEIQPLCEENGVGILCYSSLAQGLLAGIYASADAVPDHLTHTRWYASGRPNAQHGEAGYEDQVFAALGEVRRIAGELGQPMAVVSLAWLMAQPGVTSMLVGARAPVEVGWNLPAVDLALSDDVLQELAEVTAPVKDVLGDNPDMWMSTSRMR
jgi:aryl-alcohol dehydrogenase-like predicted oxidoreductase